MLVDEGSTCALSSIDALVTIVKVGWNTRMGSCSLVLLSQRKVTWTRMLRCTQPAAIRPYLRPIRSVLSISRVLILRRSFSHQGIGILASAIVALEAKPLPVRLTRTHIMYESLLCAAAHVPGSFPDDVRKDILDGRTSDKALKRAEEAVSKNPLFKALLSTTQAVDIITGGVKVNALPEVANAVVNYRVDTERCASSPPAKASHIFPQLHRRGVQASREDSRTGREKVQRVVLCAQRCDYGHSAAKQQARRLGCMALRLRAGTEYTHRTQRQTLRAALRDHQGCRAARQEREIRSGRCGACNLARKHRSVLLDTITDMS